MSSIIIKGFMTFVGLFFGICAFEFAFIFAETSVYENLITKIFVFLFLLLLMTISFGVAHVYKED